MKSKVILFVVLFMLGAYAQALYVTTDFGNGADGWISNDNQSSSYWSDKVHNTTGMHARFNGGNSRFRATFMRFDISGTSDPFEADTKLLLGQTYTKGSDKVMHVYGLVDGDAGENWLETTLCYNNAPGFRTPEIGDNGATVAGNNLGNYAITESLVLLGTFVIPGTGSSGATITPAKRLWTDPTSLPLADFLNADTDGLVTFVLINAAGTSSNNSENRFASKEDAVQASWPALVPEPATMAFLGLGCLMAVRRKRS